MSDTTQQDLSVKGLVLRNLHFTMLEVLVVTLLAGMILALILPRVSLAPKRIVVERALSGIRQAFSESGSRARAGGKACRLELLPEASVLKLSLISDRLSREWQPSIQMPAEKNGSPLLNSQDSYQLSQEIQWLNYEQAYDTEGKISFSFFPDGQCSGPPIEFELKKRRFRLQVDNISGRADIVELQ